MEIDHCYYRKAFFRFSSGLSPQQLSDILPLRAEQALRGLPQLLRSTESGAIFCSLKGSVTVGDKVLSIELS